MASSGSKSEPKSLPPFAVESHYNLGQSSSAPTTPSSPMTSSPAGQLQKVDFEQKRLQLEIWTLQMQLGQRTSELKGSQRRLISEKERFDKEMEGLQKNNEAIINLIKNQSAIETKYAVEAKTLEFEELQQNYDQLKTNCDQALMREKQALEEFFKANERKVRIMSESLQQQEIIQKELEASRNENSNLLKIIKELEGEKSKSSQQVSKLSEEINHLKESNSSLKIENDFLINSNNNFENKLADQKNEEKLKKKCKKTTTKGKTTHISSEKPHCSTKNANASCKSLNFPSPISPLKDLNERKRKYQGSSVDNSDFTDASNRFPWLNSSLVSNVYNSISTPAINDVGTMSSGCNGSTILSSPEVSPLGNSQSISRYTRPFSITSQFESEMLSSMQPDVNCSRHLNSESEEQVIERSIDVFKYTASEMQASVDISQNNVTHVSESFPIASPLSTIETSSSYNKENAPPEKPERACFSSSNEENEITDESLLEPLSTTLSMARESDSSIWINTKFHQNFAFVRVFSESINNLPRHFLAELKGERIDTVTNAKFYKVDFLMKGRGKNNFTFFKDESAKGFEISEYNIIDYLPKPTINEGRMINYKFNFDFSRYRLGEMPDNVFQKIKRKQ